jgi:CRP-like cAMP-binding protein
VAALLREPDSDARPGAASGSLASRLDTLRSTRELRACSTQELRSLLQHVDELTVPAGSRIAIKGQPCSQFVIVATGDLQVISQGDSGRTLLPGDTVGWAAMWDRSANEATVIAESDARILVMGHAQFRAVKAVADRQASVRIVTSLPVTNQPPAF